MIGWLLHVMGVDDPSSYWYAFWSGFGSDIGEASILAAAIAYYRKHACHEHRCWRIARHNVDGTPYVTCRKHHPALPDKPRRGDVARAYESAKTMEAA